MRRIVTARQQHEMLAPWRLAETQYLLPGMPARQHQPKAEPQHQYDEDDVTDYWRADKGRIEDDEDDYQEPEENDDWKHQRWMHVSPTKMEPGTELIPGGGPSPYGTKRLGPGHSSNVWIDSPSKMRSWFDEMSQHSPDSKFYYYDVEPGDPPEPSDWGHELGWKVPSARILHRHPDNATPDDFGDYYYDVD